VINFNDRQPTSPAGLTIGKSIQTGAEYNVLRDPTASCLFQSILGESTAQHKICPQAPRRRLLEPLCFGPQSWLGCLWDQTDGNWVNKNLGFTIQDLVRCPQYGNSDCGPAFLKLVHRFAPSRQLRVLSN
jgi:hypothetical protein